jgi:Leucine-rich repeat (LRR) protein
MKNIKLILLIEILLTSIPSFGQESNSTIIFQGRTAPFKAQKVLDLSYQALKVLPPEASNPEIEILILDNNRIEKLPDRIGNLKNLRILSVRNNYLSELNSSLSFCPNLEQIYLSGNENLSSLPNLSFCEKLEIVDVIGTSIREVPAWIEMMDSLFYFKYSRD